MIHDLTFDSQLPELPMALDPEAVSQLFEKHVQTSDRQARILSCRLQDVKYQPGRRCVTTYILAVEGSGTGWQTIGVVELTPAGLTNRLYRDDPQLPWLDEAADPERMAPRFATLFGSPILACTVAPVRYRPGTRCVFRYEIDLPSGSRVIFGKLLRQGAAELTIIIAALHEASRIRPSMPQVLRPLARWSDLQMVLQPEVEGRAELNDLAFNPEVAQEARERWLHEAGARLAGLHQADVGAAARTFEEDLDELREYVAPMAAADAPLAEHYGALIEQVAERAHTLSEPKRVPSHGAFRTDQFMIQGERLVMIDLDGFCLANPARDIGNFLAYLAWKAIRQPQRAAIITQAGQLFLEGYQTVQPDLDPIWQALYTSASMLKIAGRRYRSLTIKEWPLIPTLIEGAGFSMKKAK